MIHSSQLKKKYFTYLREAVLFYIVLFYPYLFKILSVICKILSAIPLDIIQ